MFLYCVFQLSSVKLQLGYFYVVLKKKKSNYTIKHDGIIKNIDFRLSVFANKLLI